MEQEDRRADDARRQDARGGLDRHERDLVALALGVRALTPPRSNSKLARSSGALHLVDLAGSERLARGATGEAAKVDDGDQQESLDALRASSLEDDGGGARAVQGLEVDPPDGALPLGAKTLMVVNVGPEADNAQETLCSLRFASQVNQCDVGGKPVKSAKPRWCDADFEPRGWSPRPFPNARRRGAPASRPARRRAFFNGAASVPASAWRAAPPSLLIARVMGRLRASAA